jgi:hypothetical protein
MRSYRKYYWQTQGLDVGITGVIPDAPQILFLPAPLLYSHLGDVPNQGAVPSAPAQYWKRRPKEIEEFFLNLILSNFWWTDPGGSGMSGFTLLQLLFEIDVYKDHPLN